MSFGAVGAVIGWALTLVHKSTPPNETHNHYDNHFDFRFKFAKDN